MSTYAHSHQDAPDVSVVLRTTMLALVTVDPETHGLASPSQVLTCSTLPVQRERTL